MKDKFYKLLKTISNKVWWTGFRIDIDIWFFRFYLQLFSRSWEDNAFRYILFRISIFTKRVIDIDINESWEHRGYRR